MRDDAKPRARRLPGNGFGKRGVARQVVTQILDHLRRFVAGEGATMMRIGVDVVAEIGQPVRVEHHEGRDAALAGTAAEFTQRLHRAFPGALERTARDLRQHQGRHVADLGRKNEFSHGNASPCARPRQAADPSQRNTSAIRSSRTIETLPLPASIWAT